MNQGKLKLLVGQFILTVPLLWLCITLLHQFWLQAAGVLVCLSISQSCTSMVLKRTTGGEG